MATVKLQLVGDKMVVVKQEPKPKVDASGKAVTRTPNENTVIWIMKPDIEEIAKALNFGAGEAPEKRSVANQWALSVLADAYKKLTKKTLTPKVSKEPAK